MKSIDISLDELVRAAAPAMTKEEKQHVVQVVMAAVERKAQWQPVVYLEGRQTSVGYKGPGWYWGDPADAYQSDGHRAVTGPYTTKERAEAEYRAYCEAMTI